MAALQTMWSDMVELETAGSCVEQKARRLMGWQECSVSSRDRYDRYLYLNAGQSCLTIQRHRGTCCWVARDGATIFSRCIIGTEAEAKAEAVRILRQWATKVLEATEGMVD